MKLSVNYLGGVKSTFPLDNAEIKFRIHDICFFFLSFFFFALQFGRRLQKILRTLKIAKSIVSFANIPGSLIISLSLNITMNQLGGASVIAIFTTRQSHGYVNTTTWLGISQFFLFLAPNFNILTTENRSRCN